MKSVIIGLAVFSAMSAIITSCSKDPLKHLTDDESRIYITNHDSTFHFTASRTFTLADSVAVIVNNQYAGKELTGFDAQFIAALRAAMIRQGFTAVDSGKNADLAMAVTLYNNDQTGLISYTDYGGAYGGYWDPYYWGYPGYSYYYPSYYGFYSYSETALAVDMFDLRDASGSNQLKNVWSALIRGSGIFDPAKAAAQVQTLFDQSSYLKAN